MPSNNPEPEEIELEELPRNPSTPSVQYFYPPVRPRSPIQMEQTAAELFQLEELQLIRETERNYIISEKLAVSLDIVWMILISYIAWIRAIFENYWILLILLSIHIFVFGAHCYCIRRILSRNAATIKKAIKRRWRLFTVRIVLGIFEPFFLTYFIALPTESKLMFAFLYCFLLIVYCLHWLALYVQLKDDIDCLLELNRDAHGQVTEDDSSSTWTWTWM